MTRRRLDLTNKKFGKLTAIEDIGANNNRQRIWRCKCDCGNPQDIFVVASDLQSGSKRSCGCLLRETNKKYNKYELKQEYGIGYDSNNKVFYFDLDDFEKIKYFCWYVDSRGAVATKLSNNKTLYFHQYVLEHEGNALIDHIDQNPSNNRKNNLRIANKIQNGRNRKNVKGYRLRAGKYEPRIGVEGESIYLGRYDTAEEAKKVRREAEIKYFGEFAPYQNIS